MTTKDVIIIGAGAAGMTAAIFCCRKKLNTLVISMDYGGQTNMTSHIENYPGVGAIAGSDLMNKFYEDTLKFGAEYITGKVINVEDKGEIIMVKTSDEKTYETKSLIIAAGKVPRLLEIPGEDKFFGRGVSTCATCDGPLFKNKTVAIVGGGNSGVEASIDLAKIAEKVYLIHRRDKLAADEITIEKAKKNDKISILYNCITKEIKGDKFVESIIVEENGEEKELKVNGIFIEIGYKVDSKIFENIVELNQKGEIKTDQYGRTSHKLIFAAGDITTSPFKQTIISAGQGAVAALEVHKMLSGNDRTSIDW